MRSVPRSFGAVVVLFAAVPAFVAGSAVYASSSGAGASFTQAAAPVGAAVPEPLWGALADVLPADVADRLRALTTPADMPGSASRTAPRAWEDALSPNGAEVARPTDLRLRTGDMVAQVGGPDLIVAVRARASRSPAGLQATITVTVSNRGSGAAGAFTVSAWRDRSTPPTGPAGTDGVNLSVPGLTAGQSVQETDAFAITEGQSYQAWAFVDSEQAVVEIREDNNIGSARYPVPDLTISYLSVTPQPVGLGVDLQASIRARNIGVVAAGAFGIAFWEHVASGPPPANLEGRSEQWLVPGGLEAGAETQNYTHSFQPAAVGSYTAWAWANAEPGVVGEVGDEQDWSNNTASCQYTVGLPDLAVVALVVYDSHIHETKQPRLKYKNAGTVEVPAGYRVRLTTGLSPPDVTEGEWVIDSSLPPGGEKDLWVNCTPSASGTYVASAYLDVDDAVVEEDEANNTATCEYTVSAEDYYEPDDTPQQAYASSFGRIPSWHSLHREGDQDWVWFDVGRVVGPNGGVWYIHGGEVQIEATPLNGDLDAILYSWNETSGLTPVASDVDGGSVLIARPGALCLPEGEYYVKVWEHGSNATVDAYTLTVGLVPDQYEPDDPWEPGGQPKLIWLGQTQTRNLHHISDLDGISFTLLSPSLIVVHTSEALPKTLYRADAGGALSEVTRVRSGDLAPDEVLDPGTYLICVSGVEDLTICPYIVTLDVPGGGVDSDSDGVSDQIEGQAPNNGDGNGDGQPDSEQANVASFPSPKAVTAADFLTLAAPAGTTLMDVTASADPPAPPPDDASFPVGFLGFRVEGVPAGGAIDVELFLPPGVTCTDYRKYGPEPHPGDPSDHWYPFNWSGAPNKTGAEFLPGKVVLHLRDGERGDHALAEVGVIEDPGSPVIDLTNDPPTATDDTYVVDEDQTLTLAAPGVLANDADPDTAPLSATLVADVSNGSLTLNADGSFAYAPGDDYNGPDSFTYQASDGESGSNVATVAITVNAINDVPRVGDISAPADPVSVAEEVQTSASFTDPDPEDSHTAQWDWGDDATSSGTIAEVDSDSGTLWSVSGDHTYIVPGVYTVTLTVSDSDSTSEPSSYQYVVVYDPNDGFVTGGGWILSPPGAYTPDGSLEGKANFGFTSRYKKGATAPTGQTEFQFRVADLDFHSNQYEWLVVAGAKAQFKGTGSINGSGDYGFMLTSIDGDLKPDDKSDGFRIKIWDRGADQMIYDNQIGEADDSDATTELGGGSIVIHQTDRDHVASESPGASISAASAVPTAAGAEIIFTLSADAEVSVAVLNIAGRLVRRVTTNQAAFYGRNSVIWNACADNGLSVPAGMYIVRIAAHSPDGSTSHAITAATISQ
jgi:VCBS repeat-containing protein